MHSYIKSHTGYKIPTLCQFICRFGIKHADLANRLQIFLHFLTNICKTFYICTTNIVTHNTL